MAPMVLPFAWTVKGCGLEFRSYRNFNPINADEKLKYAMLLSPFLRHKGLK
jgi:hypothetical protein